MVVQLPSNNNGISNSDLVKKFGLIIAEDFFRTARVELGVWLTEAVDVDVGEFGEVELSM